MAYIDKITVPNGSSYFIKDTSAWNKIDSGSLKLVKVSSLPDASAGTLGKIYLKQTTNSSSDNLYDEYITIDNGLSTPPQYTWEKIGSTDTDLSNYSTKSHTHTVEYDIDVSNHSYTPSGSITSTFTGTSTNISISITPTGDVSLNTTNKSVDVITANSGTATYTPEGTIEKIGFAGDTSTISLSGTINGSITGTVDSSGSHSHTINKTIQYLHYTSQIPKTFKTEEVVKGLTTKIIETTTIYDLSTNTTTASKATAQTKVNLARPGSEKSFSTISNNSVGDVSVVLNTGNRATGALSAKDTSVHSDSNQVMYDASVDINNEMLFFTFKTMAVGSTAISVSSATTTATTTVYDNSSITGINGSYSYTPYNFVDVTVPIQGSSKTVATGNLVSSGDGSSVVTGSSNTISVLSSVDTSVDLLNTDVNSTSTNGIAIITSINNTNLSGSHSHNTNISLNNANVICEGSYTPTGSIKSSNNGFAPAFTGTGVKLVTENFSLPIDASFEGNDILLNLPYTPEGSVTSTFNGSTATLSHTVQGDGVKTTSSANEPT